jgi:WD40 repeat protein
MRRILTVLLIAFGINMYSNTKWKNDAHIVYYNDVVMSADQSKIAVSIWGAKPEVVVWDIDSGELIAQYESNSLGLMSLSNDGNTVASAEWEKRKITIYNVELKVVSGEVTLDQKYIFRAIKLIPSTSSFLLLVDNSETNKREFLEYDYVTREIVKTYLVERSENYMNYSNEFYLSNSGRYIVYTLNNGSASLYNDEDILLHQMEIYDRETNSHITKLATKNFARDVKFIENESKLLVGTGSSDNNLENIMILDLELNTLDKFSGINSEIFQLYHDVAQDEYVAMAYDSIYYLNTNFEIKRRLPFSAYQASSILSNNLYLNKKSFQLRIADIESQEVIKTFENYEGNSHRDQITGIGVSDNDEFLFSSSLDGTIKKWNALNGNFIENIVEGYVGIRAIKVSDHYIIYSSDSDNTHYVNILNNNGDFIDKIEFDSPVIDFELTTDENYLVTGEYDGQVSIYNFDNLSLINTLDGNHWINSVDISNDNSKIAAGNQGNELFVWSLQDGTLLNNEIMSAQYGIKSVKYSPNSDKILLGCGDGYLKEIDADNLNIIRSYDSKVGNYSFAGYNSVDYTYNGDGLLAGVGNGLRSIGGINVNSKFYVPKSGMTQTSSMSEILSLNLSYDVATGNSDGSIYMWNPEITSLKENTQINDISIYPNPISDLLNISSADKFLNPEFTILDINGKIQDFGKLNTEVINVEILIPGSYVLVIRDGGKIYKKEFIKL